MDKYEIILYWSEEDKIFIAEVPELPGCMTHGDTHETARRELRTSCLKQATLQTPAVILSSTK